MAERNSEITWQSQELISNKVRNEKPILENVFFSSNKLRLTDRKGAATYVYDFGGEGQIKNYIWQGEGNISFRYKVASVRTDLDTIDYVGTYIYKFQGTVIDTSRWAISGPYTFTQSNELNIIGSNTGPTFYSDQGLFKSIISTESPAALEVRMKLELNGSSGGTSYLGITDNAHTLIVRKIKEQIKNPSIKDSQGNWIPTNINLDNEATLSTPLITYTTSKLTDGIFEQIDFTPIPSIVTQTITGLKQYANVNGIFSDPKAYGITAEAIPFRVRSLYNPSQTPGDLREYIYYDIMRDAGFYRATIPIVRERLDLFDSEVTSENWDSTIKKYVPADTNNIWSISVVLDPGVYRYNFNVDGTEVYDVTNMKSYYLDGNNLPVPIFSTGYGYGSTSIPVPRNAPFFSEIEIFETQTVIFIYQGVANKVSLVGTMNAYNPTKHILIQNTDRQIIRRIMDPNFIYINGTSDYHKIEITLPFRTSISAIDFKTLVPFVMWQRVKIFLDDLPLSNKDWTLTTGGPVNGTTLYAEGTGNPTEGFMGFGYSYGTLLVGASFYGYSSGTLLDSCIGYGYGYGGELICPLSEDAMCDPSLPIPQMFSFWDNSTDTIVAAEDSIVRWCLKPGQVRSAKKITFLSRIERAPNEVRKHVFLDIYTAKQQAHDVTDYNFSDAYQTIQNTFTIAADPLSRWELPVVTLQSGKNVIKSSITSGEVTVSGESVVDAISQKPSVWMINRSHSASASAEVIYGISSRMDHIPLAINSLIDDRSLEHHPSIIKDHVQNITVPLLSEILNIQVDPPIDLFVYLRGLENNFELQFYLSKEDAQANYNSIGTVLSLGYGTKHPTDFIGISESPGFFRLNYSVAIQGIAKPVIIGNIIATFPLGASDKIFKIRKVR